MIIVTGTQRSGTSLTIKFFKECGYDVGSTFWHKDINGGLENIEASIFFRNYIGDKSFPFSDMPLTGYEKMNQANYKLTNIRSEVIKFSYLFMIPSFLYVWHKFRKNKDKLLILKRNTESVCLSKKRVDRFQTDSLLLDQNSEQIESNFNQSLKIAKMLNFDYKIIRFPDFLNSFDFFSQTVLELGIDITNKFDVWNNLIDFKKVHFK